MISFASCAALILSACNMHEPQPRAITVAIPSVEHGGTVQLTRFHYYREHYPNDNDPLHQRDVDGLCGLSDRPTEEVTDKLMALGVGGYAFVEVNPTGIWFDGETVVPVQSGWIPPDRTSNRVVTDLFARLMVTRELQKSLSARCQRDDDEGSLLIAIDPATPSSTVQAVLYTAGQAQFGSFYFVVSTPTTTPIWEGSPNEDHQAIIAELDAHRNVTVTRGLKRQEGQIDRLLDMVELAVDGDLGCAGVFSTATVGWGEVIDAMDKLDGTGPVELTLGERSGGLDDSPVEPTAVSHGIHLTPNGHISVLRARLPKIGRPVTNGGECQRSMWSTARVLEGPMPQMTPVEDVLGVEGLTPIGSGGLGSRGRGLGGGGRAQGLGGLGTRNDSHDSPPQEGSPGLGQ